MSRRLRGRRTPSTSAAAVAAATALAAVGLAGCATGSDPIGPASAERSAASGATTLTVLAAASLTEAFTTLGRRFEAAHPGVIVRFSFGPSSGLAEQVEQGAPADVFAAASAATMAQVVAHGDAADPSTFARNTMEIAVPPGNPAGVTGIRDLGRPGLKLALCQPEVPCGATAREVFANAGVSVHPVTFEQDVKATLTKVALDEVDAGVVYVTDVRAAGPAVEGLGIPSSVNAATSYPIASLTASRHSELAGEFLALVLSETGRSVLARSGFRRP